MKIAGGAASGSVTFQRNRDSATLSGTMSAEQLAINRAGYSGRIGGTLEFASTGKSPAALIAGLAGGGQSNLSGVEFARSDPAALDRVVARSQAPEAQLDETNIAYELGQELNKGPLKLPEGADAPFAERGNDQAGTDSDRQAARRRGAQRQLRSLQAVARDASRADLANRRSQVLVRSAPDRDGRRSGRAFCAEASARRRRALRGPCDPGDRARD